MAISRLQKIGVFVLAIGSLVQAQADSQVPLQPQDSNTNTCQDACEFLLQTLPDKVHYKTIPQSFYNDFFSTQQSSIIPLCIIQPTTKEEVSTSIKIIGKYDCTFAIKSGGHAFFPSNSNAADGITLDLRKLSGMSVSEDLKTVVVGTGARWGEVYGFLDPLGLAVAGGRDPSVGVGGFLLGGGISFISKRHGWGCDNIVNYEAVLTNGTILNVTQSTHPDLFFALRGGGPNFAIITSFTLKTFPLTPVWGGYSIYALSDVPHQLSVLSLTRPQTFSLSSLLEYIASTTNNLICKFHTCTTLPEFASIMKSMSVMQETNPDDASYAWIVFLPVVHHYVVGLQILNLEGVPKPKSWDILPAVKPVWDAVGLGMKNISDVARQIRETNPTGNRVIHESITFSRVEIPLLCGILQIFIEEMEKIRHIEGLLASLPFQFIGSSERAHFSKNGGNVLDLDLKPGDGESLLLIISVFRWKYEKDDLAVEGASHAIMTRSKALGAKMGFSHPFVYLNYASMWQDVWGVNENRERLRGIREDWDEEGVLKRLRRGGFQL